MRRRGSVWAATAAAVLAIGGCSPPSEQPDPRGVAVGMGGAAAHVRSDGDFVRDVASMHMAATELSRMAVEKATSPDIMVFAKLLIHDHDAAQDSLRNAVSGHSIEWPAEPDEKHRAADELATKHGPEFEAGFTAAMIERHIDLTARLESRIDVESLSEWKTAAAARTQNQALPEPDVHMRDVPLRPNLSDDELTMRINRWAADTYPAAQKHLDTARSLQTATRKRATD